MILYLLKNVVLYRLKNDKMCNYLLHINIKKDMGSIIMQLNECYKAFGGDYESVKKRISSDKIIIKFLTKFLTEPSYEKLCQTLEEEDYKEAFRAVHSIKGISANLGFPALLDSSGILTEYLREFDKQPIDKNKCMDYLEVITKDYNAVVAVVKKFVDSLDVNHYSYCI